jgi:hypothetical protein
MSLTIEQIAAIKAFINKRGFTSIEVEMEALDHLASKVESLLEERPDMDFDLALRKAHAGLGIFGLATFEDAILKGFQTRVRKQFKLELLSYLNGTKTLTLLAVILFAFLFQNLFLNSLDPISILISLYGYGMLLMILPTVIFIKSYRKWRKRSLVVQNALFGFTGSAYLIAHLARLLIEFELSPDSVYVSIVFIISFTLMSYLGLVGFSIMKWATDATNEKYLKYA